MFVSSTSDKLPDVSDPISYLNMFLVVQLFYSAVVMSEVIILSWMKHNNRTCCASQRQVSIDKEVDANAADDNKFTLHADDKLLVNKSTGNVICFAIFWIYFARDISRDSINGKIKKIKSRGLVKVSTFGTLILHSRVIYKSRKQKWRIVSHFNEINIIYRINCD